MSTIAWLIIVCISILSIALLFWIRYLLGNHKDLVRKNIQWRTLSENIPDLLIRINRDHRIEYLNPAAKTYFRSNVEEYMNTKFENLIDKEKIRGIDAQEVYKVFETGDPVILEASLKIDSKGRSFMDFRAIPELDADKRIAYVLIIGRDINNRKLAERNLKKAVQKAEQSDQLKSAFLANMSHEIRTPLNAIVGFSNIILEDDLEQEEKERYYAYINQNSNQLINLINDIIDLSKIESLQMEIRPSVFNLNSHLDELAEVIDNEQQNRKKNHLLVFLEKDLDDSQAQIETDAYRLRQIILNLLINAIKFTPKGFIQYGYKLLENEQFMFYVRDSGIGIAPENHEEIFLHFRQVDQTNTRQIGGTGLGLSITRNLVHLLGGRIWVKSELGKGTTFYFTLPKGKAKVLASEVS